MLTKLISCKILLQLFLICTTYLTAFCCFQPNFFFKIAVTKFNNDLFYPQKFTIWRVHYIPLGMKRCNSLQQLNLLGYRWWAALCRNYSASPSEGRCCGPLWQQTTLQQTHSNPIGFGVPSTELLSLSRPEEMRWFHSGLVALRAERKREQRQFSCSSNNNDSTTVLFLVSLKQNKNVSEKIWKNLTQSRWLTSAQSSHHCCFVRKVQT